MAGVSVDRRRRFAKVRHAGNHLKLRTLLRLAYTRLVMLAGVRNSDVMGSAQFALAANASVTHVAMPM